MYLTNKLHFSVCVQLGGMKKVYEILFQFSYLVYVAALPEVVRSGHISYTDKRSVLRRQYGDTDRNMKR